MDLAEADNVKKLVIFNNDIGQIIEILLYYLKFVLDSASLKITICLKGSTLLGTLRYEGGKPIYLKCNNPMCYALLAGNQIYVCNYIHNWEGSSETSSNRLTYFDIIIIKIKIKEDIVQCIIYELLLGLIKLIQKFSLYNIRFSLVYILLTGTILIHQVIFNCEDLVLIYCWESICFCSVVPIKTFNDLDKLESIKSYRSFIKNKSGVYGIYNTVNKKQYIGSSVDLYQRLLEHIAGNKSNKALQLGVKKYGWDKFRFLHLLY